MPPLPTDALLRWYRRGARPLPWRAEGFGAWGVLVSEIMLQQTQVARVIPALEVWLGRWPGPAELAAAAPAEVLRAWDRLGYPRRALALQRAAQAIVERHDGEVPAELDALLALPGVGDYTARAVAAFAHGQRHPVVDTNTRRVIARAVHGLARAGAPRPRDLEDMAGLLPAGRERSVLFNAAMMELGATICTARDPGCARCPIAVGCAWLLAGRPAAEGPPPRRQARFEGSDRQARGALLAVLREAEGAVAEPSLLGGWPDAAQAARALTSLLADGLAERAEGAIRLPR